VQHWFAALDGKRFLLRHDFLPVPQTCEAELPVVPPQPGIELSWFPGSVLRPNLPSAQPSGLKKRFPSLFRLGPFVCRLRPQAPSLHIAARRPFASLFIGCFPPGMYPWTYSNFACSGRGLAPLHMHVPTLVNRRIQDFFRGGAQGQVHPDVHWLHSSEDPTAQVNFLTSTDNNHTHFG